jgi:hypothetical protein
MIIGRARQESKDSQKKTSQEKRDLVLPRPETLPQQKQVHLHL